MWKSSDLEAEMEECAVPADHKIWCHEHDSKKEDREGRKLICL